jgi:cephalosporin hydroxylase
MANPYLEDIGIRMDIVGHLPYLEELAAQAGLVVELGVQYGNGSTKSFSTGIKNSAANPKMMISVDITDQISAGRKPPEDWWKFIVGDSIAHETFDQAVAYVEAAWGVGGKKIDVILLDSVHEPEHVLAEITLWSGLTSNNTIWLIHDVCLSCQNKENCDNCAGELCMAIKDFAQTTGYTFTLVSKECEGLVKLTKA